MQGLAGKHVAIMVSNGFEETQMSEIQRLLLKSEATVKTISTEQGLVNGWHGKSWGHYFPVDKLLGEILAADFDILIIPGGARSIAKLKQTLHTRRILTHFVDGNKPVAAFAEAIELLAQSDRLKNRTVAVSESAVELVVQAGGVPETSASLYVDGNIMTLSATEAGTDWPNWLIEQFSTILQAIPEQVAA